MEYTVIYTELYKGRYSLFGERERESRNERLTPVLTVSVGSAIVLDLIYLEEI